MSDRKVVVKLSANVAGYVRGMNEAARETYKADESVDKLQRRRDGMRTLGVAALGVGTAITGMAVMAAKAAVDWESAWAGVTKTVEGTPEQLAAVEEGLRGLARELPASHEEIAGVAEAAGQLGVQTGSVVAFTETMINLGETTNLSADEAATALARFMNVMGTSQDDVDRLGSALVGLGNNYATTESEILALSTRLSKSGVQVGLSEGEVLGLATALSSVGIEAEAGGSAFSKVMIDIAASVDEGGERLSQFAEVSGVSADEFAAKWKDDPGAALALFIQGLADAESQGSSTLGILADLGITEVRMRDALLGAAAASDDFTDAMAQGNAEFESNNALADEAAKRYETVEAQLGMAKNSIVDAAISLGSVFLPAVAEVAGAIADLADWFAGLPQPVQEFMGVAMLATGAIVGLGGAAVLALPKLMEFSANMAALGLTGGKLRGSLKSLTSFMGGPLGIAFVAAAAAAAAYNLVMSEGVPAQEAILNAIKNTTDGAKQLDAAMRDSTFTPWVTDDAREMLEDLPALMDKGAEASSNWFVGLMKSSTASDEAFDSIERLGEGYASLVDGGDVESAINGFRDLAESQDLTREQQMQLLNEMPAFKESLFGVADGLGIAAEDSDLLAIALGEVGPAQEEAADTAQTAAGAYLDEAGAAEELNSELDSLIEKINESNDANQSAISANADYQEAIAGISDEVERQREEYEEANGSLEGFNLTLDENTVAGSKNASMLADVAGAAQNAAAKQYEVDKKTMSAEDATRKYNDTLSAQREAFIKSATEAGYNADAVEDLADEVFALPDEHETKIIANTATAMDRLDAFKVGLWGLQDKTVTVTYNEIYQKKSTGWGVLAPGYTGPSPDGSANGNMYAYANGGFGEFRGPDIYRGGENIHKFAEPETGWEAYISGKPSEHDRNVGIWMQAGERLGIGDEIRAALSGSQQSAPMISGGVHISSQNMDGAMDKLGWKLRTLGRGSRG